MTVSVYAYSSKEFFQRKALALNSVLVYLLCLSLVQANWKAQAC